MRQNVYEHASGAKDPRTQVRGARSRAAGAAFEQAIEAGCAWYEQQGIAKIEKTPEPFQVTGEVGHGQFRGFFSSTAQQDFKGTLRGGRAIAFEAKFTESDRILQSRVTDEQRDCLEKHFALGALCMVVVGFGFQDFYSIPWQIWRDMKAYFGRKYVKPSDIEHHRIPFTASGLRFLDTNEFSEEDFFRFVEQRMLHGKPGAPEPVGIIKA